MSETVVETLADLKGGDVTAIGPLYEVIDPAALDALFRPSDRGDFRNEGYVSFPIEGYEVTVHATGRIEVEDRT